MQDFYSIGITLYYHCKSICYLIKGKHKIKLNRLVRLMKIFDIECSKYIGHILLANEINFLFFMRKVILAACLSL
ncbi:hypothetical protein CEV08_01635 [Bartonella tribocorum]|uniref:Uncharacterized protein n=1 Tax=Bartonella tribocorum TaxID=85701 RepID=A0A2M6UXM3_9HYPH|nr:hypothetical protein CEV08_01635 [Bartonella tribocorum]